MNPAVGPGGPPAGPHGVPPTGAAPPAPASGVSTLPLPPTQYIAMFTDENMKRGKIPQPPPVIRDAYSIFSVRHHPSDPIIQPLESQGIKRLYPQNVDHKKELKKMNHSLLANFLDLLDVMVKNPGGPKHPGSPPPGVGSLREEKIEDIQLLFFHMHHLINEFRPHQARETLRVMMELQKRQRYEVGERFHRHLEEIGKMLQSTLSELQQQQQQYDLELLQPTSEENSICEHKQETRPSELKIKDHMMCDMIDEWSS